MYRFYAAHADLSDKTINITDQHEIHHITTVLRLAVGDKVRVFNEGGEEAVAVIQTINRDNLLLNIAEIIPVDQTKKISVILACAIPKKAKFEFIIEKCTELGVEEIIPLETQRTEVRISAEKAQQKSQRYQTVAINAAKQSKRRQIPKVHPVTKFSAALKFIDNTTTAYIPYLGGERKELAEIFKAPAPNQRIIFFIGPEGDFTPQEITAATTAGCIPVSLGQNVLKVDTAAISVVALANLLFNSSPGN